MRKYKLAVLIGRFQPFHNGHKAVLDHGLKIADKVLIFLGSDKSPRTITNPWTSDERTQMILESYSFKDRIRLQIVPLEDRLYNDNYWMRQIQVEIAALNIADENICLLGFKKDKATTRYLNWFPQWKLETLQQVVMLNATDVRDYLFHHDKNNLGSTSYLKSYVPEGAYEYIVAFEKRNPGFQYVKNEYLFQYHHDLMWASAPYPPMFITVDSVVMHNGSILMIKRRAHPGKDLWALPGGYLNKDERIIDGAIRELLEETKIKVPEDVLRGSIEDIQVFDAPKRSTRGRIVTHAVLIQLKNGTPRPRVKGADDALKAKWIDFADLQRKTTFEDHYDISHTMVSRKIGDRRQ